MREGSPSLIRRLLCKLTERNSIAWASAALFIAISASGALLFSGAAYAVYYNMGMFWRGTAGPPPPPPTGLTVETAKGKFAGGLEHSCASLSGGTVKCWGNNLKGQLGNGTTTQSATPVSVSGISGAIWIATGTNAYSCAVLSDGTVKCWGDGAYGKLGDGTQTDRSLPVTVSGLAGATRITAGNNHTCALISDGTAKCWGENANGRLGDGTTTSRYTPVAVSGLTGATSIIAGYNHTCAILNDGSAKCWGYNFNGQLGDGTTTSRSTPVTVSGLSSVAEIELGYDHTCSVLSDGTGSCWGRGNNGQLGNGLNTQANTPVIVSGLAGAVGVASGLSFSCAVLSDGTAKCWGDSAYGKLGNGFDINGSTNTPTTVLGLSGAVGIIAGYYHVCAVLSGGTVKCWGNGMRGQFGSGAVYAAKSTSENIVPGLNGVIGVASLANHSCALLNDGTAKCWGYGGVGSLGTNFQTNSSTPVTVSGLSGAITITASSAHSCALLSGGTVKCWGDGSNGRLGDGAYLSYLAPFTVSGLTGAAAISTSGYDHTCVVLDDATAKCWGTGTDGRLGNGGTAHAPSPVVVSGLSGATSIAAGGTFSCALLNDGTAKCWGAGNYGQLGNAGTAGSFTPVTVSGLSGAISISNGAYHSCVLLSDGSAKCWGYNNFGQLGDGTYTNRTTPVTVSGLSGIHSIMAGGFHTCVTLSDGTAKCWGQNLYGQLGNGNTTSSSTPVLVSGISEGLSIAPGDGRTCMVLGYSGVRCWGRNDYSELSDGFAAQSSTSVNLVYGLSLNGGGVSSISGTSSVAADGVATSTITVNLKDATDAAWSGVTPTFSAQDGIAGNTVGSCSVSDGAGVSTCTLKSTFAESKKIWMTSPYKVQAASNITFTAQGVSKLAVYGPSTTYQGSCTGPFQVEVQDASGNPVVAGGSGISVTVSGLGSSTLYTGPSCVTSLSSTFSIGATETSKNFYLADTALESITLSAASSGLTNGTKALDVYSHAPSYPAALYSTITGTSPVVADGVSTSSITITIKDTYLNALSGITPTFSATDTGATNVYGACSVTDASGISTCTLKSTYVETKTLSIQTPVVKADGTVNFTPGAPTKLGFTTTPPGGAVLNTDFGTQPVVSIQDAAGNPVGAGTDSITLAAFTDSGCTSAAGGTLSVTTNPLSASAGVATFAGVKYSAAGAIYLKASASGLTSACSSVIYIAGTPTKLGFTTQPSSPVLPNVNFSVQPAVSIQDASGNFTGTGTDSITLSAYTDSGCTSAAGGTLSATTNPLAAAAGLATFAGVKYNLNGTIYIKATTGSLTSACSSAVVISSPPVYDLVATGENGSGAATYTAPAWSNGTNRLLILAVTWRNTTAMSTVPTGGPGGWTSVGAISQGTSRTEIFRAFAAAQQSGAAVTITVPSGAKSTAVLMSFSNVDTSGSNGSGAVLNSLTTSGTGANPSLSITPANGTINTLVVGCLGSADATAPTAGTGFTLRSTVSSSGGGSGATKATTSCETSNTTSSGGGAVNVPFTRAAIDWTQINMVLRGP